MFFLLTETEININFDKTTFQALVEKRNQAEIRVSVKIIKFMKLL